jgi:hypothetical protein
MASDRPERGARLLAHQSTIRRVASRTRARDRAHDRTDHPRALARILTGHAAPRKPFARPDDTITLSNGRAPMLLPHFVLGRPSVGRAHRRRQAEHWRSEPVAEWCVATQPTERRDRTPRPVGHRRVSPAALTTSTAPPSVASLLNPWTSPGRSPWQHDWRSRGCRHGMSVVALPHRCRLQGAREAIERRDRDGR